MTTVMEALSALFALAKPTGTEEIALDRAAGRVLAEPVTARRDQPPFAASAMDGYAVPRAAPGDRFRVIGEAAAGAGFDGTLGAGEAVRIFTGAPVPDGAKRVVIQEDVTRDGDEITLGDRLDPASYIRPLGGDFSAGARVAAPRRLGPGDITLLAAMNIARVTVRKRPEVAIVSTGDELVWPGERPGPHQIIASNALGLAAMLTGAGAHVRRMPIARDTPESLTSVLEMAQDADLIVTIGGASVGDHDLVAGTTAAMGMKRAFYKVAMRPGKPLMAGRLGDAMMVGLPGNPVSAIVCGTVFLRPVLDAMLGLPARPRPQRLARLTQDMDVNGAREHYMRARLGIVDGVETVTPFDRQDSSLMRVLADADCLLCRPPHDPARKAGDRVGILEF